MKYTFETEHDLAYETNEWLRRACYERGIETTGRHRGQLQGALLAWKERKKR